jgi:electron transfer flavoprotein alpha subunit
MIGQSGRTVSPDLFISIGASGAPHYTTGFAKAKLIVAIDKNPKAPIFDIADFGVVGDLKEIIPALVEALEPKE